MLITLALTMMLIMSVPVFADEIETEAPNASIVPVELVDPAELTSVQVKAINPNT